MINVGDLSAYVTEWQGTNRGWPKIIKTEHYMKCETEQLKLELA